MDDTVPENQATQRPSEKDIKSTWRALYSDPLVSSRSLKSAALSKAGLGPVDNDGGITLRSIYWRHYHDLLPAPSALDSFSDTLLASRQSYARLRRRYLLAPDGRWASDCSPPLSDEGGIDSPGAGPSRTVHSPAPSTEKSWDPLSLESESPWKTWFAHLELRQTIRQDVDRTFPDMAYFQSERVRRCMVSILFLYSVLNPDVGYRQGMHELLAVCFWVIDRDSLARPEEVEARSPLARDPSDEAMIATLDRRYVEHDAFALYGEIMKSAKAFYEWRAEEIPRNRNTSAPPTQAPIIARCRHIHNDLIGRIDPQLWERLENEGVEAQIWAIRWLRLMFTRELPFAIALRLWDGVFAEDPGLEILDLICVAMLLLIRNELIEADYPTLLTQLLHYPAPSPTYPFDPSLILSQALFLRDNISPASGVEVVIQNQDILGVKAQPPERADDPLEQSRAEGRGTTGQGRVRPHGLQGNGQQQPRAGVQGLAQGWLDRAQAAGLDKAVLSAVSDLRRNLPDTSSAYSYLPNLPFSPLSPPPRDGSFSSIPSTVSALPNRNAYFPRPLPSSSPASSPATSSAVTPHAQSDIPILQARLRDQERQMAELRLAMLGMGKAMSGYLSSLRPPDVESGGETDSWSGIQRVSDSLLEAGAGDVEDLIKEWAWHDGLEHSGTSDNGIRRIEPDAKHVPDLGSSRTQAQMPILIPDSFPSPSLSRPTPQNQPLPPPSKGTGPVINLPRTSHPTPPGDRALPDAVTKTTRTGEGDPLAGLGVTSAPSRLTATQARQISLQDTGDPLGVGR